jgi:hypothetical protein
MLQENDGGKNDFALCMMAMVAQKVTETPRHNSFHEGWLLLARFEEQHDAEVVSASGSPK